MRLARCVDSESICFTLGYPCHGIDKRGGNEKQHAENQCEQRKPGRIGNAVDVPFISPAIDSSVEENPSKRETDENKNSIISYELRAMIEHVMAHLMCHDHANFRERALLQQIVIERNTRRTEKS